LFFVEKRLTKLFERITIEAQRQVDLSVWIFRESALGCEADNSGEKETTLRDFFHLVEFI